MMPQSTLPNSRLPKIGSGNRLICSHTPGRSRSGISAVAFMILSKFSCQAMLNLIPLLSFIFILFLPAFSRAFLSGICIKILHIKVARPRCHLLLPSPALRDKFQACHALRGFKSHINTPSLNCLFETGVNSSRQFFVKLSQGNEFLYQICFHPFLQIVIKYFPHSI